MPALPKFALAVQFALALLLPAVGDSPVQAAPPANSPPASAVDYGGRDSALPAAVGEAAPDPAASAGRALGALVVVLAGVGAVVYALKRFDLVKPGVGGKPARISGPAFGRTPADPSSAVSVVSSQALPGGAMLHVVRVGERMLLLGATPQSVTPITEWDTPGTADLSGDFEEYLTRADSTSGIAAANARLRSLLSPKRPEEPS